MFIALSRVTETAVACSSVCPSIFLCGKADLTNIEAQPEDLFLKFRIFLNLELSTMFIKHTR